jgi:glucose/arabinose dehydrogenase
VDVWANAVAVVTTLAGSGTFTFADGTGTAASFRNPTGVAVLPSGVVAVADQAGHRIRLITPGGVVTTLAGDGVDAVLDGTGTGARFWSPTGIAVLPNGNFAVAERDGQRIRLVTPGGVVTTLAGSTAAFADGTSTTARFREPSGIATLPNGNLVVADTLNERIRLIAMPDVIVTTLAGSTNAYVDATGAAARFDMPRSVAVFPNGNIVVADRANHRIRLVTPEGVVTTLAGSGGAGGTSGAFLDGTSTTARFNTPSGVAVLPNGNVVVADTGNNRIRLITMPGGAVTTLAGDGTTAIFNQPHGIAVFPTGVIVVAELAGQRIRLITPT